MAMIRNAHLEIDAAGQNAKTKISYNILPSQMDVWTQQAFAELVDLIGADALVGETGQDRVIAGGSTRTIVVAENLDPIPREVTFEFPVERLDEDMDVAAPRRDELVARITLTPISSARPTALSNFVFRGGPSDGGGTAPS